jgi:hypothetical protein
MSRDAVLTRIELRSNDAVLAEGPADSLANGTNGAVRVELLADCAGGGNDRRVLMWRIRTTC